VVFVVDIGGLLPSSGTKDFVLTFIPAEASNFLFDAVVAASIPHLPSLSNCTVAV